jgi:predicted DCC family thiol-disulfide oxidoreductase YuxK
MGAIVLFDGVCNFCNGAVNWVIERDTAEYFKFAALQSEVGQRLSARHRIDQKDTDSVILIEDGQVYTYSDAALRIARKLDGAWSAAFALRFIPRVVRDAAYKVFARYRYVMFGRQDQCMLPTPEVRARFL